VTTPWRVEFHHHKLILSHKITEIPFLQNDDVLVVNLRLLVRIQFGIIEIRVVVEVIFVVEFFVELVRIGVVVVVVVVVVAVAVAVAVAVRNGVGFFFEETKILIVIFGGSVLEFRERGRELKEEKEDGEREEENEASRHCFFFRSSRVREI
jgi:hypothetical protein